MAGGVVAYSLWGSFGFLIGQPISAISRRSTFVSYGRPDLPLVLLISKKGKTFRFPLELYPRLREQTVWNESGIGFEAVKGVKPTYLRPTPR